MKKSWNKKNTDFSGKPKYKARKGQEKPQQEVFQAKGVDELDRLDRWEHDLYEEANIPSASTRKQHGEYNGKTKGKGKWQNYDKKGGKKPAFQLAEEEKISNISTNNSERLKFLDEESILSLDRALSEPKKLFEVRLQLPDRDLVVCGNRITDIETPLFAKLPKATQLAIKIRVCKELMERTKSVELASLLASLSEEFLRLPVFHPV